MLTKLFYLLRACWAKYKAPLTEEEQEEMQIYSM